MRLHRLSFGSLGPFPGEHVIDLDAVAASGLFLLEGPTGAGKSTVLDAITFALYGSVAGRAASKDRLHSDFTSTVDPYAELEFSVGARRYRIRRTPTFERVKRDGSGTTTVNATVRLWRLIPSVDEFSEELMSNRVREADDEIRRLLGGLSLEQFCQVVILPQGEFATFLRADADQRRDVLQRLFSTGHYQEMENQAVIRRQAAQAEVAQARQQLRDAAVSLGQALGTHIGQGLDVDEFLGLEPQMRGTQIAQVQAAMTSSVEEAVVAEQAHREASEALQRRFRSVSEQHEIVARRARLESERDQLAADSVRIAELVRTRELAVRVSALVPMFTQMDALSDKVIDIEGRAGELARRMTADSVQVLGDEPSAEAVAALATSLRTRVAELIPAVAMENGIQAKAVELAGVSAESQRIEAGLETDDRELADLPMRLRELVERRDHCRARASRAADLMAVVADETARLQAWTQLDALESEVVAREDERRAAIDAAQQAIDEFQSATQVRLAGMAGELAQRLTPDEPCEVCGSRSHPAPAVRLDVAITQERLTELQDLVASAGRAREEAQNALNSAVAARENCRIRAGEKDPSADLALHESELAEARAAEREANDLDVEIARVTTDLEVVRERVAAGSIELATIRQRIDRLTEELNADRERVDAARGPFRSVVERSAEYEQQASIAQEWAQMLGQARAARQQLAELDRSVVQAALDTGCSSVQEARESIRSATEIAAAADEILAHESASAVNLAALAEIAGRVSDEELEDLELARAAWDQSKETLEHVRARLTSLEYALREVNACATNVGSAQERIENVSAQTASVVRVADALTGQGRVNHRRMTLSTYVLRERFASVVDAASRRLDRMSGGRYVLERDEALSGNKRAGLGLVVLDQWSGGRRDPRTLSGGESFYTSLSLALGLADVVRDEVGGVDLETLFIDEGFGSLDPDALESVLEVIDSLRDGGRVVGIVSHVTELKDRISERIEVRRRPDGTSSVGVRCV